MKAKRIFMSLFGVVICAVSVGIFKIAALGVDPFQSLMSGLDALIPLDFGTVYLIANVILLGIGVVVERHNIGVATFLNLFLLGYLTDFTHQLLKMVLVDPSLPVRVLCLVVGIVLICLGMAFYMTADMGVSPYDAVSIVLSRKWKKIPYKYCRIITDVICVIAGAVVFLIAGGKVGEIPTIVGVGTVVTAFFMGPLIDFFNRKVARPMLGKKE